MSSWTINFPLILFQVNEVVPEEKCSLIPKQMCHSVTEEPETEQRRLKKRATSPAAENPLSFLRRHYLNQHRQSGPSTLARRSRNFNETAKKVQQVCKTVPEQICEKKRVNPRVVEKEMVKKFCREPRSFYDRILVAKLKQKSSSLPIDPWKEKKYMK